MIVPHVVERTLPWLLRAIWIAVAVAGGAAVDAATDDRSDAIATVATWGATAIWLAGAVALAVPSVATLTAARLIVPLAPVAAAIAWSAGASAGDGAAFVTTAVAATVLVVTPDIGRAFVQASAYGAEDRHLLRPPPAYALAAVVAWCLWAAAVISGPLLLGARAWWAGALVSLVAVALTVWAWPRWHQLGRRWLVLVPAGVVVHDPLVLAETLMIRRRDVAALHLARAGTQAADLTGPAGGHTIEIATSTAVTALLAGGRGEPRAIHLTAGLVAASRPGRALAAAAERRFPVG